MGEGLEGGGNGGDVATNIKNMIMSIVADVEGRGRWKR